MYIAQEMSLMEKLNILSDAAKYDVACTSSGVDRGGKKGAMGNTVAPGICHSFSADGRCISLLKVLYTNECVFNCSYCLNRCDNDIPRASFTPDEVCTLTMEFYRRNYIEGLFLSSGVLLSPNYTMDLIYQTLYKLRNEHHFNGYIHVKAIPGADTAFVEKVGFLADRMSINLELPTAESLSLLAPCKSRKTILTPMRLIQNGIAQGKRELMELPGGGSFPVTQRGRGGLVPSGAPVSKFVPAGQSTQMIIGATPENDFQIMSVAEGLYQNFDLKRVFYSAFVNVNEDSNLPMAQGGPPLLREHRLYQADWLLRYYDFQVKELLSEDSPNFNVFLDPKCDWALRHLEQFPMEINQVDYNSLLRIPGIGYLSARRIVKARKQAKLGFGDLKKIGVVLKRAVYFITCNGKMMYPTKIEEDYILRNLLHDKSQIPKDIREGGYEQLCLPL
jgi:putative DNA modification/repair radical SAM protein